MPLAPQHAWPCSAALVFLLGNMSAWAQADVCRAPATRSEVSLALVNHDDASLAPPPGDTRQQHRNLDLLVRPGSRRLSYGFGHRYRLFNFDGIEPQTNAHLHTSLFPFHWLDAGEPNTFRFSLAPALSGSSNVIGHPQEYRSDTLQWLVALAWRRELSAATVLRYGVCGDHRFGEYLLYPSVGIEWRPDPSWLLDLGLPDSRLVFRFAERWSSVVSVAPNGNEWHVMDRSRTQQSQFVFESYAVDWQIAWRALPRLAISGGIGTNLHSRYELTLSEGERVRLSTDPVLRISAGLRWNF